MSEYVKGDYVLIRVTPNGRICVEARIETVGPSPTLGVAKDEYRVHSPYGTLLLNKKDIKPHPKHDQTGQMKHHVDVRPHSGSYPQAANNLVIECSCGFGDTLPNGTHAEAAERILYHRVQALEAAVGMDFKSTYHS